VIPATTAANQLYGRWMARNASATQDALAAANATALEAIASVRTVRSFACEAFESRRYDGALGAWYELCNAQAAATGIYFSVMYSFLSQLCVPIALLGYGGALVMRSEMRADTLIAFMLYQGQLQEYVANLLNACTSMYKSSGAAAAVFDIIDRGKNPPAAANDATHASGDEDASLSGSIPRFQGRVEFDSVTFAYPARPTKVVLNGFRLVARPGARVALVGASGAGKSTVFHLLQRFYDPDDGRVLLDGVDVRTLNHGWLHKVVALIGQEPVLFAGSVLDNITYSRRAGEWNTLHDAKREKEKRRRRARRRGYAEVDDEERNNGGRGDSNDDDDDDDDDEKQMERVVDADVVAAATAGNAAEFIDQLPRGYHTRCGERGVALSGGQKQRIAIARAILMNPSVLLLDEATSALDRASERGVLRAMDAASAGRTTLIIAHRTSTVMDADAICVLRGGVVVEEGTHAALMSRRGTPPAGSYADLSSSRGGGDDDATPP
jgi:ABC-type multidrug transport system fused ATPase/permease subunit